MEKEYLNPEPVPPASQLAILPFLAGVDGLLREDGDVTDLRITMHRAMTREGNEYLQQVCAYLQSDGIRSKGVVGRTFPVDEGIIGAAFKDGHIWRTKAYSTNEELQQDLSKAMPASGDSRSPMAVGQSYLAIPFLGPDGQIVLILYADCKQLNFFADDDRIKRVISMCHGFCRLLDGLQKNSFPNLRNFPLQKGRPITGSDRRVYEGIQERLDLETPRLREIRSFNYEASVA